MELKTGIYKITNTITGMMYIGSTTVSFRKRWQQHLLSLNKGIHYNLYLQNSWTLHGEESFFFEILEICKPINCLVREDFYIQQYSFSQLYNNRPLASNNFGFRCSDETKKKMSEAQLGKRHTDEAKKRMSIAKTGRIMPDEQKANLSAKNKGRKKPDGFGANISRLKTGNKYCLGKECSQETRNKIAEANKGRVFSEESKKNMLDGCTTKIPVFVLDITNNDTFSFETMRDCQKHFGMSLSTVGHCIKTGKPYHKKLLITLQKTSPNPVEYEAQLESEETPHPTYSDTEQ